MIKVKIKSGKSSRQDNSQHYSNDGYDEYGKYVGPYQGHQAEEIGSECSICGGEITSSHLVFTVKRIDHEVHTACLITSMALVSNGIAIVAGFFKRNSKSKKEQLRKGK